MERPFDDDRITYFSSPGDYTEAQRGLITKHGTPADFEKAVWAAVGYVSFQEYAIAVTKYIDEFDAAGKLLSDSDVLTGCLRERIVADLDHELSADMHEQSLHQSLCSRQSIVGDIVSWEITRQRNSLGHTVGFDVAITPVGGTQPLRMESTLHAPTPRFGYPLPHRYGRHGMSTKVVG